MSFDVFKRLIMALSISTEVKRVMTTLDRGIFSQSELAYGMESPSPILNHPPINMTAANLHAQALDIIFKHFSTNSNKQEWPRSALDAGTGTGYIATALSMLFPSLERVVAIDVLEPLISKARRIHNQNHFSNAIEFKKINVFELAEGEMFDIIHGGATVHQDLEKILEHLNPGGIMVMPYSTKSIMGVVEVFGVWEKSAGGRVTGPREVGYVRYTPMVPPDN